MKRPTPYKEAFPAGTAVDVADREFLDDFVVTLEIRVWKQEWRVPRKETNRIKMGPGGIRIWWT